MKKSHTLLRLSIFLFFAVCLAVAPVSADGSVWIDTTGVALEAGETVSVPVIVSTNGEYPLFALGLIFEKPTNADVSFNQSTMTGFTYSDDTGKVAAINLDIKGEQTLFYLDVTPSGTTPVSLSVIVDEASEGSVSAGKFPESKTYTSTVSVLQIRTSSESKPAIPSDTPETPLAPAEPQTPGIPSDITPSEPSESTPDDIPEDIPEVPNLPSVTPESPAEPHSPIPLLGILVGLGLAVILRTKR